MTFHVLKLAINAVLLEVENLACQCLTQVQDGAAAKLGEVDEHGEVFAHFASGVFLEGVAESYFLVRVLHFAIGHHHEVLIDFAVALVGVDDYVEVLVAAEHLSYHTAERLFQYGDGSGLVYSLIFQKLLKFAG